MAVLGVIAIGVFIKQYYYDPTVLVPGLPQSQTPGEFPLAPIPSSDLADFVPADMGVLSHLESFGPEDLFEKINGKAELYLSAGFLNLRCQRFERNADPQSWAEVFVYDMGTLRHAFAVYSAQSRAGAEPLDLTPFSYRTTNALFWVHGRYYIELIASAPSDTMMESMLSFGKKFVRKTSVERETIHELELFPRQHLEEGSIALLISDAFGFDEWENVFTASYNMEGERLIAFLSHQERPEDTVRLAEAYHAFLLKNGGTDVPLSAPLTGAAVVEILGTFELIFYHGQYVAGVREAQSREAAEKLALRLKHRLEA
jgi:hypothetical protein